VKGNQQRESTNEKKPGARMEKHKIEGSKKSAKVEVLRSCPEARKRQCEGPKKAHAQL
jgi:hypothetical protein